MRFQRLQRQMSELEGVLRTSTSKLAGGRKQLLTVGKNAGVNCGNTCGNMTKIDGQKLVTCNDCDSRSMSIHVRLVATSSSGSKLSQPSNWGAPRSREVLQPGRCPNGAVPRLSTSHGLGPFQSAAAQNPSISSGTIEPKASDATISPSLHSWLFELTHDATPNHIGQGGVLSSTMSSLVGATCVIDFRAWAMLCLAMPLCFKMSITILIQDPQWCQATASFSIISYLLSSWLRRTWDLPVPACQLFQQTSCCRVNGGSFVRIHSMREVTRRLWDGLWGPTRSWENNALQPQVSGSNLLNLIVSALNRWSLDCSFRLQTHEQLKSGWMDH